MSHCVCSQCGGERECLSFDGCPSCGHKATLAGIRPATRFERNDPPLTMDGYPDAHDEGSI
jgi:hypothetical protein